MTNKNCNLSCTTNQVIAKTTVKKRKVLLNFNKTSHAHTYETDI